MGWLDSSHGKRGALVNVAVERLGRGHDDHDVVVAVGPRVPPCPRAEEINALGLAIVRFNLSLLHRRHVPGTTAPEPARGPVFGPLPDAFHAATSPSRDQDLHVRPQFRPAPPCKQRSFIPANRESTSYDYMDVFTQTTEIAG